MKRHDSTPPGSWLREQYEKHRQQRHPVEDAFDRPREDYDAWRTRPLNPGPLLRPLAEVLLTSATWAPAPVSSYAPQMARELYGDDEGA